MMDDNLEGMTSVHMERDSIGHIDLAAVCGSN